MYSSELYVQYLSKLKASISIRESEGRREGERERGKEGGEGREKKREREGGRGRERENERGKEGGR